MLLGVRLPYSVFFRYRQITARGGYRPFLRSSHQGKTLSHRLSNNFDFFPERGLNGDAFRQAFISYLENVLSGIAALLSLGERRLEMAHDLIGKVRSGVVATRRQV